MPPTRLTYREIADDLQARIVAGEHPPGSLLPSYARVAEIYSVSVTTAQNALRMLRERGLTTSVLGVGTFVVDEAEEQPPSGG